MKTPKYMRPAVDFTSNAKPATNETIASTLSDDKRIATIQAQALGFEKSNGKQTTYTFKDSSTYTVTNN